MTMFSNSHSRSSSGASVFNTMALFGGITAAAGLLLLFFSRKKSLKATISDFLRSEHREEKEEEKEISWERVGTVKQLFIYPMKSGKPIETTWLDCVERGAWWGENRDRRFLCVDAAHSHRFLTAREYPQLVLIDARIVNGKGEKEGKGKGLRLRLTFPPTQRLPPSPNKAESGEEENDKGKKKTSEENNDGTSKVVEVDLTEVVQKRDIRRAILFVEAKMEGYDCGDAVAEALAEFLGLKGKREPRLIYFSDELYTERDIANSDEYWENHHHQCPYVRREEVPEFSEKLAYFDKSSFTVLCEASIRDLNEHLKSAGQPSIDVRTFRPNIYVEGTAPYAEDTWARIRVGKEAEREIGKGNEDQDKDAEKEKDRHASAAETATATTPAATEAEQIGGAHSMATEFICYRPCTRCSVLLVDPDRGERRESSEPLKTLRGYRLAPKGAVREKYAKAPIFGSFMTLVRPGRVQLGDPVYALRKPFAQQLMLLKKHSSESENKEE